MPADRVRELDALLQTRRPPRSEGTSRPRRARVEWALERDLAGRPNIGKAERAALRAQARAVDVAAALEDPHLVTEANRGYLELRTAAGLTASATTPPDAFEALLAELSTPDAGAMTD
jgi:hypothetical protein